MILYFLLWIINLLFALKKKNSKPISIITLLALGVFFISNNGMLGDAAIYKGHFEDRLFSEGVFEAGYTFIEKILPVFGVNTYNGLLIFLFFVSSFFWWVGLKKYNISYHCIFSIIMPFIFPTYTVAIRFFIASSIMVTAIKFLNENKYLLFTISVICAGLFHVISLFYIILILCGNKNKFTIGRNKRALFWAVAIFSTLNYIIFIAVKKNIFILAFVKIVAFVLNIEEIKISAYATTYTNYGSIIFLVIYLCGLATAYFMHRTVVAEERASGKKNIQTTGEIKSYSMINYYINLVLSATLPFIAMNLLFYRLLIVGHISNAIMLEMHQRRNITERRAGCYHVSLTTVFFAFSCLSWFIPEIVGINDITIEGMLRSSFLFSH